MTGGAWKKGAVVALIAAALWPLGAQAGDWKLTRDLTLENKAAEFHVDLKGYAQWDVRDFRDWDIDPALRNPTSEFPRRLRIGVEGEWKKLGFELDVDPHDETEHLKNAILELKLSSAFRIRAGNMKLPISAELLTSESKVDFIERAMAASRLGPDRDVGVELAGDFRKKLNYTFGVFKGDGRVDNWRAGTTVGARLVYIPFKGLDLGGSFTHGTIDAQPLTANNGDPSALSADGKGPSGFKFYGRKFVNGRRIRFGFDATWQHGPFGLKGEYLETREQRLGQGSTCTGSVTALVCNDLSEIYGRGWSFSGTWLVTGDKKAKTIKPKRPFFGGPGAVEIGVRYDELRFDDFGSSTGFEGAGNRARNIRPAGERVLTGGVSWWPVQWVRLVGNVVGETYKDPLLAPISGKTGTYVTLVGRVQLLIP